MHAFKHIVVATDFGEVATHATAYGVRLARELGAQVTLFHAYQVVAYACADGATLAAVDLAEGLSTAAESAMGKLAAKHRGSGVPLEAVIRVGPPAAEVHRFASEVGADLIVLGTHGRRGLSRAFLGSVAEAVVRTSTRPVVVVPFPPDQRERHDA